MTKDKKNTFNMYQDVVAGIWRQHIDEFSDHLQPPIPERLWHYTNIHGAHGILTSRKIWCTNLSFMNDMTELNYAWDLYDNHCESLATEFPPEVSEVFVRSRRSVDERGTYLLNIFATSLSEVADDVTQWRAYGGTIGGYSISFDTSMWGFTLARHILKSNSSGPIILKVIYDLDIQKAIICDTLNAIAKQLAKDLKGSDGKDINLTAAYSQQIRIFMLEIISRFKNPCFSSEREWRLLLFNWRNRALEDSDQLPKTLYRIGQQSLIPYTELPLNLLSRHNNCVAEVMVGPQAHRDMAVSALKSYIDEADLPFTTVTESMVPLRF